ncbi:MAG: hypothetical protein K0S55_714, partial [Clostridia bacterium]|nr:hypothetical protein [Clostridia bacterium]
MQTSENRQIKTEEDFKELLERFNGFHDGYITDAVYKMSVKSDCKHTQSSDDTQLKICILVTSMVDTPVIELTFGFVMNFYVSANSSIFGPIIKLRHRDYI